MTTRLGLALLVLLTVPACTIYFGGDDDDDCAFEDPIAPEGLRNPETGACEYLGGGGGGCGAIEPLGDAEAAPQYIPDWGACPSACEALDEQSCWAAERCRAVYLNGGCGTGTGESDCQPLPSQFLGCWSIAPSGPAYERVACESLDAYECSRHNDCVGNYTEAWLAREPFADAPSYAFQSCGPEPVVDSCLNLDCGIGYHCEERCFPCDDADGDGVCPPFCEGMCVPDEPPGTCADVTCGPGEQCELQCRMDPNGGMDECWPVCVPVGGGCAAIDCGPGYHCEEQCVVPPPCLPDETCEPPSCGPVCVPDTNPGDCEAIADEMACIAASCRPLYTGTCWIDASGQWQCTDTMFVRCETPSP